MSATSRTTRAALRIVATALVVAVFAASAPARAADDIVLTPRRVSEHAWFFQGASGAASIANKGFMSNAGFVVTGDGVVVFDALGTPALGRAMIAAIGAVTRAPIRRVIVSHYHADHIYGLQEFKKAGAEIWAHRKAELYLSSELAVNRLAQRRAELSPGSTAKRTSSCPTSGSTATRTSASADSLSGSSIREARTRRRTR